MTFDRFSPQAFEELVQALSVQLFGPGVIVFGAGPDGAREATFNGPTHFPNTASAWDGYIVVQSKCKAKLSDSSRDADWAVRQFKKELDKFSAAKRGLKCPEYYLACTNVSLSAEPLSGGRAKMENLFSSYATQLGLKGWHIIGADEIRTLLHGMPELRQTFTAWLTPDDVLAELLKSLNRPDLSKSLTLGLARDIFEEREARLRDGGQDTEQGILLHQVFIDLPRLSRPSQVELQPRSTFDSPYEQNNDVGNGDEDLLNEPVDIGYDQSEFATAAAIFKRCSDKFTPHSQKPNAPVGNRLVLLGGPGQGKSTLTQFVVQVLRARLLSSERIKLKPETAELIDPILSCANSEDLENVGATRFPIRIDLPKFADELAGPSIDRVSLLSYIARRLSRQLEVDVDVASLRTWLGQCPSLIVLDGLDEVPPSSNRQATITAINQLMDEIHFLNADCLIIVTTRPQGYDSDLNPQFWEHWELSNLNAPDALKYAGRLASVRSSDPERIAAVLSELDRASRDPITMQLMISPLQVTIMFGIAFLRDSIPSDRWDLFDKYYNLLRDREIAKGGASGNAIRTFKLQIDALHRKAGLKLQIQSETAGSASAFLTTSQFEEIALNLLQAQEYSASESHKISAELVRLATQRLVLLRTRVTGQIAFDVRSLQEFMAASEMTSDDPHKVIRRLRAVALSAHWRHVFRIAASKIFSRGEFEHMRQDVLSICDAIEKGYLGDLGRLSHGGAKLALDLASDGVSASVPKFHKALFRTCLSLLDLGPNGVDGRITNLLSETTSEIFFEECMLRIALRTTPAALGAWSALASAAASNVIAAQKLFTSAFLALDDLTALEVFSAVEADWYNVAIRDRLIEAQWNSGPTRSLSFRKSLDSASSQKRRDKRRDLAIIPEEIFFRQYSLREGFEVAFHISDATTPISTLYNTIGSLKCEALLVKLANLPAALKVQWEPLASLMAFSDSPSALSLSNVLEHSQLLLEFRRIDTGFPWILESALEDFKDGQSPAPSAREVANGLYGDAPDWYAAEERLANDGIFVRDFAAWNCGRYVSNEIATIGLPYPVTLIRHNESKTTLSRTFLEAIPKLQSPKIRVRLIHAAFFAVSSPIRDEVQDAALAVLLEDALRELRTDNWNMIARLFASQPAAYSIRSLVKIINAAGNAGEEFYNVEDALPQLISTFNAEPNLRGLLPVIAMAFRHDDVRTSAEALGSLQESAFHPFSGDGAFVRSAVTVLRLHSEKAHLDDRIEICTSLASILGDHATPHGLFESLVIALDETQQNEILCSIADSLGEGQTRKRSPLVEIIARRTTSALTGLSNASIFADSGF